MEKKELEEIKKLFHSERTKWRNITDIRSAILLGLGEKSTGEIKKDYEKAMLDINLMKTAIIYCLKDTELSNEMRVKGKQIIGEIDSLMKKEFMSPRSKIYGDNNFRKFSFHDGSEATLENYDQVKNAVLESMMFNRLHQLSSKISDALGFITILMPDLWQADDTIEEVDFPLTDKEVVS